MSHLTDLNAQAKMKDAELGNELEREFKTHVNGLRHRKKPVLHDE